MALVAAGASTLAKMKSDPLTELQERLAKLERPELDAKTEELKARMASLTAGAMTDYAVISPKIREKLAKEGKALKDGSFPIRNVPDLKNAIKAFGRAKDKDAAKKHIIKRAKELQRYYDLIPEEWRSKRYKAASNEEVESMKARVASAQDRLGKALAVETEEEVKLPNGEVAPEGNTPTGPESGLKNPETGRYTPQTQPRDESGKFRRVLARLKQNLGTAGLQKVLKEAKYLEQVHELGDYVESVNSGAKLLDIIDRLDEGALNKVSLENVRSSATELGKVIANLPLGFNDQTEKVRYSDLPPALRDLMDSMMERVEAKIGKEDADIATESLRGFKNGSDVYNQGEISAQMNKMLRLLT
jgi:adenine-specific DNA methylase